MSLTEVLNNNSLSKSEKERQVRQLLIQGANVNERDHYGETALMVAAWRGYDKIVMHLIKKGARLDDHRFGMTALMYAVAYENIPSVKHLISANANVNCQQDNGSTALMIASAHGYVDSVQILLDANADVDIDDMGDKTALMKASMTSHVQVVQLLLRSFPNIFIGDKEVDNIMDWIFALPHVEIQALIMTALHRSPTVSLHSKFRLY